MKNRSVIISVLIAATLWLIPLLAMPFTKEVNWTLFDFMIAGILLSGTGLMIELAIRKTKPGFFRMALIAVLLIFLLLLWAELAVGLF